MTRKKTTHPPVHADAVTDLGPAEPWWRALIASALATVPGAEIVWKTYAGKTGTQCVIRGKDRNYAYLRPETGSFLMSTALSAGGVESLRHSALPAELVAEIVAAPTYPEGTPARVRVDSPAALAVAVTLLSLKVADVAAGKKGRKRSRPPGEA